MDRRTFWILSLALVLLLPQVSGLSAQPPLSLLHTPVLYAVPYEDLIIKATPNRGEVIQDLILFYRGAGKRLYESSMMNRGSNGEYTGVIPAAAISKSGVVYFIAAHDRSGNELMLFASPERPHGVVSHSVVLLKSANIGLYDEVIQGIRREAATEIKEFDLSASPGAEQRTMEKLERDPPELIITMGLKAAQIVRASSLSKSVPMVYSMISDPRSLNLKTDKATGVSFDISVRQSLATFKTIIPNVRNVGVIYNPARTGSMVQEARSLAPSMGFEILTTRIEESGEVTPTLRAFEKGIDALWVMPDSTVLSGNNYNAILDFTRRNRIPLFVFSQDLVKKGALAALSPDYNSLGSQTGKVVRRVLEGADPGSIPIATPEKLNVALNLKTARDLKLEGIAQRLMDYAGDHEYAVKVYK